MAEQKRNDVVADHTLTYLVGVGVTHSVAPSMHNQVSKDLGLPWKFTAKECPSIQDVVDLFRAPTFAGGVVTMPYKISIMTYLDGLDDQACLIGACNNVYRARDGSLRGTNTDWRGVQGCLASGTPSKTGCEGRKKPALIVGAGGAARAAIYALHHGFGCSPIYVANRDQAEVEALLKDTGSYNGLDIIYISTLAMTKEVIRDRGSPYFVIGTVPDFAPKTQNELEVHAILEHCFAASSEKGVVLDMCFKPRNTRTLKLARQYDWTTVEGVNVIGHQIQEQYRLWTGPSEVSPISSQVQDEAWRTLHKAADENPAINF